VKAALAIKQTGRTLDAADAVMVLGAVSFALLSEVPLSESDLDAIHAAQGTVSSLRRELWTKAYAGGLRP
jgi:hypothetical protein